MSDKSTNHERTAQYLEKFSKEKILTSLIHKHAPTILDVGANEGNTIREFKSWWPRAMIHAFEPQHECWPLLEAVEQELDDITINHFALGEEDAEEVVFYTHGLTSGQSGFSRVNVESKDSINLRNLRQESADKVSEYANSLNHERQVGIHRGESYLQKYNIADIDLLKIDTQGHESEVLNGMGACLANVSIVITELMFYDFYERSLSFSDIEQYLLPAGFKLYDISHISKNPINGRTDWIDVIYVNAQKNAGD